MADSLPVTLTGLQDRLCLVIGGGEVGERKARYLLDGGATARVIAPRLTAGLADLAASGQVEWLARGYQSSDLDDAYLVIVATDSAATNHAAAQEARGRGLLVNVVDDPQLSTFIVPAIVRRGELTIAVNSGGAAPSLSAELRRQLEGQFPTEWAEYITLLGSLRGQIGRQFPPVERRRAVWRRVLAATAPRTGQAWDRDATLAHILDLLEQEAKNSV